MSYEEHFRELLNKLARGETVLFLGAGVSKGTGAPLGRELVEELKAAFPRAETSAANFLDVCQEIVDTPGYGRSELERFINGRFYGLQPSGAHESLPFLKIPAIFTTNYDEIIERAYEKVYAAQGGETPKCRPITRRDVSYSIADVSTVKLFKLMGTLETDDPDEAMVLTRSDYNRNSKKRQRMLDVLGDFVKAGTIIYVGYSFLDRLAFEVIDEAYSTLGPSRIPYAYALIPGFQEGTKLDHLLKERRIIPIPMSFEELAERAQDVAAPREPSKTKWETIEVGRSSVRLSVDDLRAFGEYFQVLTQERLRPLEIPPVPAEKKDAIRQFLRGGHDDLKAFAQGWDFRREVYNVVWERAQRELQASRPEDNKFLLLLGSAGLGKSIILRRLAYDAAKAGVAVAVLFPYRGSFDFKLIDKFCDEVVTQVRTQVSAEEVNPKVLLVLDDASSSIRHVQRLVTFLKSRAKPVLIVGAARTNEWTAAVSIPGEGVPDENIIRVPEEISPEECFSLVRHLSDLEILPKEMMLDQVYWYGRVQKFYEGSFFATVYGLVTDARKRLEEIIEDEYANLGSDLSKTAYEYVCCVYRYGVPLKLELLVRTLRVPYSEFIEKIYLKEARDVIKKGNFEDIICDEEGPHGGVYFRTRQRLIAEKLSDRILTLDQQVTKLCTILSHVNPFDQEEMDTIRTLLVTRLGPNASNVRFTLDQRRSLYDSILQNEIEDSAILHHYGILEMDVAKSYEKALGLMRRALALARPAGEFTTAEPRRNILTSLAGLYSRMAIRTLEEGEEGKALELHALADDCYEEAIKEDPSNLFPYHSKAYTRFGRAKKAKDRGDEQGAVLLLCEALEVIEEAKANVPEEELDQLLDLESEVHFAMGDYPSAHRVADDLIRNSPRDPRGYFLKAKLLWREVREANVSDKDSRTKLEKALGHLSRGRENAGDDKNILRLMARINRKLRPRDYQEQYKVLGRLYTLFQQQSGCTDLEVLFNFGVAAFHVGEMDEARRIFAELEDKSAGHPFRSGIIQLAWDVEADRERILSGTVKELKTRKDGFIQSREVGWIPFFRPAQKWAVSKHESVQFNIAFNYRGMLAVNLRR